MQSNVAKYCEFKLVSRLLFERDSKLENVSQISVVIRYWLQPYPSLCLCQVPSSRADVFNSKEISLIDKRLLMKVITNFSSMNVEDLHEGTGDLCTCVNEFAPFRSRNSIHWILTETEAQQYTLPSDYQFHCVGWLYRDDQRGTVDDLSSFLAVFANHSRASLKRSATWHLSDVMGIHRFSIHCTAVVKWLNASAACVRCSAGLIFFVSHWLASLKIGRQTNALESSPQQEKDFAQRISLSAIVLFFRHSRTIRKSYAEQFWSPIDRSNPARKKR